MTPVSKGGEWAPRGWTEWVKVLGDLRAERRAGRGEWDPWELASANVNRRSEGKPWGQGCPRRCVSSSCLGDCRGESPAGRGTGRDALGNPVWPRLSRARLWACPGAHMVVLVQAWWSRFTRVSVPGCQGCCVHLGATGKQGGPTCGCMFCVAVAQLQRCPWPGTWAGCGLAVG